MLELHLSATLFESTNTKIRFLMRMAFGSKNTDALIALTMLALGSYRPTLPDDPPRDPPAHQSEAPYFEAGTCRDGVTGLGRQQLRPCSALAVICVLYRLSMVPGLWRCRQRSRTPWPRRREDRAVTGNRALGISMVLSRGDSGSNWWLGGVGALVADQGP